MRNLIILLGPPGCGKGTQADLLSKHLNYPHISTGAMLRDEIAAESELGKKAKDIVEAGQFISDSLIYDILFNRLEQKDCKKGVILDGFPRNVAQAEVLDSNLNEDDQILVVNFVLDHAVIIERMTGRRVCPVCGTTYHTKYAPPREEGKCDRDGGELFQRKDDAPKVVTDRLHVFAENTFPLIDFYRRRGQLVDVDCEGKSIEDIFSVLDCLTKD